MRVYALLICGALAAAVITVAGQGVDRVFTFRIPGSNLAGGVLVVDPQGNSYIAGSSYPQAPFPITDNAAQKAPTDMFVAKVDPTGDHLIWATYLGGHQNRNPFPSRSVANSATGIAVDPEGNVFVVGSTATSDFPVVNAVISAVSGTGYSGFLTKISADGSRLVYSTYLGDASAAGTTSDPAGNAYVALSMAGTVPYITTDLSAPGVRGNAVVVKFNPAGGIVFATRFAGSDSYIGRMVVDNTGQVVVAGNSTTAGLRLVQPIVRNCWTNSNSGSCSNPLVAKLDRDGRSMLLTTLLGGTTDSSIITSLAVDPANAVYVAGGTKATDFPTRFAYQSERAGDSDYFLSKIAADNTLETSTYFGSDATDTYGQAMPSVLVDLTGQPTIMGLTNSRAGVVAGMQHPDAPLYVSRDDGASWTASAAGLRTSVYSAAISERDRIWYAGTSEGVYRSSDGGATWALATSGIAAGLPTGRPDAYDVAVDRAHSGTVYAGTYTGLYKSDDHGDTWRRIDSRPFFSTLGDNARVVVDGNGVIFLGTQGLRRSSDGGRTWTDLSASFDKAPTGVYKEVETIAFDPNVPGTMYALQSNVLFRSSDGGDTWRKQPAVRPDNYPTQVSSFYGIAASPGRSGRLFASDWLWMIRSQDGGQSWTRLDPLLLRATFRTDPTRPDIVFAIDSWTGKSALRSRDGGETWTPIEIPTQGSAKIVVDPLRPSTVLALGGIRTLPAAVQFDSAVRQVRFASVFDAESPNVSAIDPTGGLYLLAHPGGGGLVLTKVRLHQP